MTRSVSSRRRARDPSVTKSSARHPRRLPGKATKDSVTKTFGEAPKKAARQGHRSVKTEFGKAPEKGEANTKMDHSID